MLCVQQSYNIVIQLRHMQLVCTNFYRYYYFREVTTTSFRGPDVLEHSVHT